MATRLEIINKVNIKLGQSTIPTLNENDSKTTAILSIYDSVRNAEQASYRWAFCTTRTRILAELDEDSAIKHPVFGNENMYKIPDNFLRAIKINNRHVFDKEYCIENDYILYPGGAYIDLIFLKIVSEEAKWPPVFTEAFSSKLAYELCSKIKKDIANSNRLQSEYLYEIARARKVDAIQRIPENIPDGPWITNR